MSEIQLITATKKNDINKETNNGPSGESSSVSNGTSISADDSATNIEDSQNGSNSSLSEEHQQILKKEEEILTQFELKKKELLKNANSEEASDDDDGSPNITSIAFDLYMIIVKTYFAVLLQFGDFVATSLIQTFLPDEISNQIISGRFDMQKIIPTLKNSVEALQDKEFREELGNFFVELKNVINPEIKKLLESVFKIFVDVATKNSSKVVSIITTSLSAFPPAALFFSIASLAGVGVNTMSSGLKLAGISMDSANNLQNEIPSLDNAKKILSEKGLDASKILKGEGIPNIGKLKTNVSDTIGKSFKRFQKLSGIDDNTITNIKNKATSFGDSLKTSAKSELDRLQINPEELKSNFQSGIVNAKKSVNDFLTPQSGGSMKQMHNLSKKISSRILKSLKDFSNTDIIRHKTKRRKPHKHTKKHRRYRK